MWTFRQHVLHCFLCVLPTECVNMDVTVPVTATELLQDSPILLKLQATQKLWSSEEHIQSWIENNCLPTTTTENGRCEHGEKRSIERHSSLDSDVFLQLPTVHGVKDDDLELGAEAKHFTVGSHHNHMISPRLSPMGSFDGRELEQDDGSFLDDNQINSELVSPSPVPSENEIKVLRVSGSGKDRKNDEVSRESTFIESQAPPIERHRRIEKGYSLDSYTTYDSFASSFDRPSSLAAALQTNAEDVLFSLGFVRDDSVLRSIPTRFFQQPSAAYGINVEEIHQTLLEDEEIDESDQFFDSTDSNPIHHPRFSQSSIDLSSNMSADSKRLIFQGTHYELPNIFVSQEDSDRPNTPTTTSGSIGMNFMKLATLEELPEPASRSNSFDNERKGSLVDALNTIADKIQHLVSRKASTDSDRRQSERKFSDTCSRVDTLTDDNVNESKNTLDTESYKREALSSKSSLNTIVNVGSLDDERNDTTVSSTPCDVDANSKLKRRLFSKSRSQRLSDSLEENVFAEEKSKATKESNGVIENLSEIGSESVPEMEISSNNDNPTEKQHPHESPLLSIKSSKSTKTSLKDFFKRLKNQSVSEDSQYKPVNIQVILTPPDETGEDVILTFDDEGNEVVHEISSKKSYLSSAISAITNIISSKHNDTKDNEIKSEKNESQSTEEAEKIRTRKYSKDEETETGKSHSNEEVPPTSVISENDVTEGTDKKGNSSKSCYEYGGPEFSSSIVDSKDTETAKSIFNPVRKLSDPTLNRQDNNKETPTSFENLSKLTSRSLVNIFHLANNTHSPFDTFISNKQNDKNYKKYDKNSDPEQTATIEINKQNKPSEIFRKNNQYSSDEETSLIKCPLGKNCTLSHHCHSDGLRHRKSSTTSSLRSVPLAHEHFDYLLQQYNSLRNEIKKEFENQTMRLEASINDLADKLSKDTRTQTHEDGNIKNEVDELKRIIMEKDEEIVRLKKIILRQSSTNNYRS